MASVTRLLKHDGVVALCRTYFEYRREVAQLLYRADEIEDWLRRSHGWSALDQAQRRALPEAQEMHALDAESQALSCAEAKLLRRIARTRASSLEGVLAKLGVAAHEIDPMDYPVAHRILTGAVADLRRL